MAKNVIILVVLFVVLVLLVWGWVLPQYRKYNPQPNVQGMPGGGMPGPGGMPGMMPPGATPPGGGE